MREKNAVAAGFLGALTGFASKAIMRTWVEDSLFLDLAINLIALALFILITLVQTMAFLKALRQLPVATATLVAFYSNTLTCVS